VKVGQGLFFFGKKDVYTISLVWFPIFGFRFSAIATRAAIFEIHHFGCKV